jgi:cytochrome P450 family 110
MTNILNLRGPSVPASEQVRRWIETPIAFWEECAKEFGAMVALDLGSLGPVVLLSDPEPIKEVFQLSPDLFECRQFNEHYRYVMGNHSVLLQDGDHHRRQRRLLAPLLRHDSLPKISVIQDIVTKGLAGWPVGKAFNPRMAFHDVIFQVMVQLLLGGTPSETSQALISAYRESVLRQSGSWGPWRNFARLQPKMRELLADEIRARREDREIPGILTAIAQARTADSTPVPDVECEDHVFSLMVAGVDPTAVALTWVFYWLCRDSDVHQKLMKELEDAGESIHSLDLLKLPYLNAVFSETLRMYPVVPTPSGRKLKREMQIGGQVFPAGTTLVPCTYLVHRREDLYPQSDRFHPERFLGRTFAAHEYFPFGGGARACLGEMMAEVEFKAAVAAVLSRWTIATADDRALSPSRHGTLLAPPDEFAVIVYPRARTLRGTSV